MFHVTIVFQNYQSHSMFAMILPLIDQFDFAVGEICFAIDYKGVRMIRLWIITVSHINQL